MAYRHLIATALAIALLGATADEPRAATDPDNPDWPCVQRKVPAISAGMVWAGPPISEDDQGWRQDDARIQLVGSLAARRLPLEEAYQRIDEHVSGLTADRNDALSLLFLGLLQTINRERAEIMEGIERFARKQKALAGDIQEKTSKLNEVLSAAQSGDADDKKIGELEEELIWASRIFDEREQALIYVCESPVLLEQRLFALARHLMGHLER